MARSELCEYKGVIEISSSIVSVLASFDHSQYSSMPVMVGTVPVQHPESQAHALLNSDSHNERSHESPTMFFQWYEA